ncbi:MAG: adenylate kinase [Clostridia bacterium]|nr:adenylate kinase [Clostridia bacterium]
MRIILLGAPGAGKGTQAKRLSAKYNLLHISTGDIFRENIKNSTDIGKIAKFYIDKGQLVPDSVTVELVKERLEKEDCVNQGYLLDGFPRTIEQAIELDKFSKIDIVLNVDVDFNKLVKRITGRRVCPKCGASYHVTTLNGKTDCELCKTPLIMRDDDNEETVTKRIEVYNKQTAPLIEYYKKQGKLETVDGNLEIDETFDQIIKILG